MNLDSIYANEQITRFTLENGLTVILKPDSRHAVVSTQYWVKTGSIHEGRFLGSGISHYLEHLMFKGTSTMSGREIQQEVHQLGGYFNAYTSFDRTVYYIDGPSESAPRILDILSEMMKDPVFPVEEVEKEKNVILREIDMRDDDPDSVLFEKLFATAFREHPYKYPIIGYKDLFVKLKRSDLLEYYRSRYVPNNMVLVMVGDFDPLAVEAQVRACWDSVPRGALTDPVIPEEQPVRTRRLIQDYGDYQITRAVQVFLIPGFSHADSPVLSMLAEIIGSGESSILWQELRQKQKLVHQVYAAAWNTGTTGLFYTGLISDPGKRDAALQALTDCLERIASGEGLEDERVQQVIRRAIAREIRSRAQVSGQAGKLGVSECVAGDIYYSRNLLKRLQEITTEDVKRVARQWLKTGESLTLTLEPNSQKHAGTRTNRASSAKVQVHEGKFSNGLRWVVLPDHHLPMATIGYMGLGGPGYDPLGQSGLSCLTSTLLAKDTAKRTDLEIVTAIEGVGGSFYGNCGNNTFSLIAGALSGDFNLAADLVCEGLTSPLFSEETFELEKQAQLASIQEADDDLVSWSLSRLRREFHGQHPYGYGASGELDEVSKLSRQHVVEHWERLKHPENGVLLLAGDLDWEKELERLEKRFQDWSGNSAYRLPDMPYSKGIDREQALTLQRDRQQAIVMQAFPSGGITAADDHVESVLVQMLSGMASHLFEKVREEQGLAYFVSARRLIAPNWGMLYFYAGTQPETADRVLREYKAELQRLASDKWEKQELTGAQTSLRASLRIRQQSLSSRITDAGVKVLFGLPLQPWDHFDRRIGEVTRQDIRAKAEMLLNAPSLSMIVKP